MSRRKSASRNTKTASASKFAEKEPSVHDAEEEAEGEGQVESIEGMRQRGDMIEYWVHWMGYDQNDNTWEPLENLVNCHDHLALFHAFAEQHAPMITAQSAGGKQTINDILAMKSSRGGLREPGLRGSVSSSISNQNGRSKTSKAAKTSKGAEKRPSSAVAANEGNSEDEFPLAFDRDSSPSRSSSGRPTKKAAVPVKKVVASPKKPAAVSNNVVSEDESTDLLDSVSKTNARLRSPKTIKRLVDAKPPPSKTSAAKPKRATPPQSRSTRATPAKKPKAEKPPPEEEKPEEDEDNEEEEMYTVESILGVTKASDYKTYYLVKWAGYGLKECTWETSQAVKGASTEVNKFLKQYGKPDTKNLRVLAPEGKKFFDWMERGGLGSI